MNIWELGFLGLVGRVGRFGRCVDVFEVAYWILRVNMDMD